LDALEKGITLLRAQIAGKLSPMKKPTLSEVTSTMNTMANIAKSKSSGINVIKKVEYEISD